MSDFKMDPKALKRLEKGIGPAVTKVAANNAREAVEGIRCPHGEAVKIVAPVTLLGRSQGFDVDAHCEEGLTKAKAALEPLGVRWDE